MWELDCEESWAPKNWCFWTVVLEKTLESPLDCKEIQPVHPKGDQSWVFFGRTDAKAETPILWPPHAKCWLIGKDSDAGRDWGQEEKETIEDEMAGWHHQLDGREFEWSPGVGDGQGGLACCNSWGRKESDMTEGLDWTELNSTDIIMFGSSRQSHYSSGLGGKWVRGFGEHRESCPSVQKKSTDWPPAVIKTWGSSGVIRTGTCVGTPGHLQSRLSWESDPWVYTSEGSLFSSMVLCRSDLEPGGGLDAWGQSHLRCPSFLQ